MKSQAFLAYAHGWLSAFGFVLFMVVFVAVTVRVFSRKKEYFDQLSNAVFDDGSEK